MESTNLLRQDRVATNLLRQTRPSTCHLKLAPPSTQPITPPDFETIEMSVAAVGGLARIKRATELTPSATGFFLTESGALVTCWHVVNRDKIIGLTVLTRDGRVYPVREVLAVDTTNDLAILQVEGQGFRPLPIAPEVRQGAPVWVLGYPFPWYYMLTSGIVSGQYILANRKEEMELVEHHC